eukprot:9701860-Lingulodinium_polyedra.AAC.1
MRSVNRGPILANLHSLALAHSSSAQPHRTTALHKFEPPLPQTCGPLLTTNRTGGVHATVGARRGRGVRRH